MSDYFKFEMQNDCLVSLLHPEDPTHMNWVKAGCHWGKVVTGLKLAIEVRRQIKGGFLQETYAFTNPTEVPIYTSIKDIKIEIPFPDEYVNAKTSLTKRCHTHIWCGENSSYVLGLRMGGVAPHLGLILKEGSLAAYSVIRDREQLSNDRGVFYLHLAPMILAPGETKQLIWELHWVKDKLDFEKIRQSYPNQLQIDLDHFVTLGEQQVQGKLWVSETLAFDSLSLQANGQMIALKATAFSLSGFDLGEQRVEVNYGNYHSHFCFLVYPKLTELLDKRVHFIADHQQHQASEVPELNGSFLSYDNEEGHQYYDQYNDYNAGRERVGMGVIIARYLQKHKDEKLYEQWQAYDAYVLRELFNPKTGEVFNDYGHRFYFRLYNYPWLINYFYEVYKLTQENKYVEYMDKAFRKFYQEGGTHFYPIGWHFSRWLPVIQDVKGKTTAQFWLEKIEQHADTLASVGLDYPAHEVNYEQSIVAPAVSVLLEAYMITEKQEYLNEAKKHLAVLELFNGFQPDHHLNQVAIRHWDGYWFGKRKVLGDTFPHYWSSLTGYAYLQYYQITGEKDYLAKAQRSIRASLSLIGRDGSASCAYLYPFKINETLGKFYDPLANDQDWALYYADLLFETKI